MPPELFELCMVHDGDNPTGEMIYDQTIDVWGLGTLGLLEPEPEPQPEPELEPEPEREPEPEPEP